MSRLVEANPELAGLLGVESDMELARYYGVSSGSIAYLRRVRGIPSAPTPPWRKVGRPRIEDMHPELLEMGHLSEQEAARRAGVSPSAVYAMRARLNQVT